jgi:hypothetical protein
MLTLLVAALQVGQVSFDFDDTRLKSIQVGYACILGDEVRTSGGYLIGSEDGSDAQGHSVISVGSSGGWLKTDNAAVAAPPPYRLSFRTLGPNRLGFTVSVGPMPQTLATLSLPFDFGLKMMDRFRFGGDMYRVFSSENDGVVSGSQALYSDIHPKAEIRDLKGTFIGKVGGASTDAPSAWAEADGPYANVRFTVTASDHYKEIVFMNHPGTHNVEFGFGKMAKGDVARLSGEIVVTAKAGPTNWTYDGPSEFNHQIGRAEADGWSVRVGDPTEKYMCFGPYATEIGVGPRVARFTAMLDNVTADNEKILTFDVADARSGRVLATGDLHRRDFARPMTYQTFSLPFYAPPGGKLEFRALWHGVSYARVRGVAISR